MQDNRRPVDCLALSTPLLWQSVSSHPRTYAGDSTAPPCAAYDSGGDGVWYRRRSSPMKAGRWGFGRLGSAVLVCAISAWLLGYDDRRFCGLLRHGSDNGGNRGKARDADRAVGAEEIAT